MKKFLTFAGISLFIGLVFVNRSYADAPVQVALFNPVQIVDDLDSVKGVRLNLGYGLNDDVSGVDLGLFNVTDGEQKGIQLGIYNSTFEVSGLQFGLVNRTDWLNGIQIGLINIHEEGDWGVLPLLNFSF